MLDEASDGVGEIEPQAAEGRTAMERIDGMAQDEGYAGSRRKADGNKLLAEHVVREVVIGRVIIADDTKAVTQMPKDAPFCSRSGDFLYIAEP